MAHSLSSKMCTTAIPDDRQYAAGINDFRLTGDAVLDMQFRMRFLRCLELKMVLYWSI
jgi:hypothetical protein